MKHKLTHLRATTVQRREKRKYLERCRLIGFHGYHWWQCKVISPLGKADLKVLKN
jgi:hypothetical protein